jgi:hypothetical protein
MNSEGGGGLPQQERSVDSASMCDKDEQGVEEREGASEPPTA